MTGHTFFGYMSKTIPMEFDIALFLSDYSEESKFKRISTINSYWGNESSERVFAEGKIYYLCYEKKEERQYETIFVIDRENPNKKFMALMFTDGIFSKKNPVHLRYRDEKIWEKVLLKVRTLFADT